MYVVQLGIRFNNNNETAQLKLEYMERDRTSVKQHEEAKF